MIATTIHYCKSCGDSVVFAAGPPPGFFGRCGICQEVAEFLADIDDWRATTGYLWPQALEDHVCLCGAPIPGWAELCGECI